LVSEQRFFLGLCLFVFFVLPLSLSLFVRDFVFSAAFELFTFLVPMGEKSGEDTWIIDSGASDHMTYERSYFTHLSSSHVSSVTNANGETFPVLGTCSIQITPSLTLHNVLYVPALSHHLISVPQINAQSKCSVTFFPMYVVFQDLLTKEIIGRGYLRGRLFHLDRLYAGEKPGKLGIAALTSSSDQLSEIFL